MRWLKIGKEEKKEEEDRKKKPQDKNITTCPIPQGGHNQIYTTTYQQHVLK